jgi:tellurite methyltransferase
VTSLAQTQGWEPLWADLGALSGDEDEHEDGYWRTPEPSVLTWAESLWDAGGRCVLDLGCGVGRHTVALARLAFAVAASDVSSTGLAACAAWLTRDGLAATLTCHEMKGLLFLDSAFDGLLAYNVIYHTTVAGMRQALAEIRRVLRLSGWLCATIIARDDSKVACCQTDVNMGKCQEIGPFTFVYRHDAPGDKYLPHHYCDEEELRSLLADFIVAHLYLDHREYANGEGLTQVGVHYHVQAQRFEPPARRPRF